MYLKLDKINSSTIQQVSDFLVMSEVLDTGLSYYRPVIVRTTEELDIWFGTRFSSRDYLIELLRSNVSLYLYKAVSLDNNKNIEGYINLETFEVDPNTYYYFEELPKEGESNVIYNVIESETSMVPWIYYLEEYIKVSDLPQNIESNNSNSVNNRDTLRILMDKDIKISYPSFEKSSTIEYENLSKSNLLSNLPDITLDSEALSLDLVFEDSMTFDNSYLVINGKDLNYIIWFRSDIQKVSPIVSDYYDKEIVIDTDCVDILGKLRESLESIGYYVKVNSDNLWTIWSDFKIEVSHFYKWPGFSYCKNEKVSLDILEALTEDDALLDFHSLTIGSELDSEISIEIEKTAVRKVFRLTISRFQYREIYEGSSWDLVNKVNNESKLVQATWKVSRYLGTDLPTGKWNMMRGKKEKVDHTCYINSIKIMFESDHLPVDYILVPNINLFTGPLKITDRYYEEYNVFLEIAKRTSCQVLIENLDSRWKHVKVDSIPTMSESGIVYCLPNNKHYILNSQNILEETEDLGIIYPNNYKFNLLSDVDNYLIYFFRSITAFGNLRPGYYAYLSGLLKDSYSIHTKEINYNSPVINAYTEDEDLQVDLKNHKSNYLVNNNLKYYYSNYQNGDDFVTTGWMRFCLGKISRELEKNKWDFISHPIKGDILSSLQNTLNRISTRFSIIRKIEIKSLNIDKDRLDLSIETGMSDLADQNISLDITLNYNK